MGTGGLETNGRSGNLAAYGGNNHVFVVVHPAAPPATDICGFFTPPPVAPATVGTPVDFGCVAVFGPTGQPRSDYGGFGNNRGFGGFGNDGGFGNNGHDDHY
jgi:hypothetical protein